jgi:5-formyltetrahydrofolate cyclo-ligase
MTRAAAERSAERRRLRLRRQSLTAEERRRADRAIARRILAAGFVRSRRRTAVYLAALRGEASLERVIESGWRRGARLYAPRILSLRRRRMALVALEPSTPIERSAYGLLEPAARDRARNAMALDVVLLPLLGFDRAGHRLGMGGGFYDRFLHQRRDPARSWRRPLLVGVAYACQELDRIEPAAWDVGLDYVVTEHELIHCRRRPGHRTVA